jgi:hypothetical protein
MEVDEQDKNMSPVQSSTASAHYNLHSESINGSTTVEKKGLFNDDFYFQSPGDPLEFEKNCDSDDEGYSKMTTISH